MAGPAITFAVPFYTGIRYLPRALASVQAQKGGGWRALVCDNDSPEAGSEALVRSLGDARIAYHKNPKNLGMAGNFNRCLELAETDLVTLLHADDELLPSYAAVIGAVAARHPDAVGFFCRAEVIGPDSKPVLSVPDLVKDFINPAARREAVLSGEGGVSALLRGNFIMAPTLCFRKSVLGARRFPEGPKFVLDLELTTSLLLAGERLVGVPDRCYRYRRHEESATAEFTRTQERFREEADYYDRMREVARARGWGRCQRIASQKRMLKLNLAFSTVRSCLRLRFGQAYQELGLIREL